MKPRLCRLEAMPVRPKPSAHWGWLVMRLECNGWHSSNPTPPKTDCV